MKNVLRLPALFLLIFLLLVLFFTGLSLLELRVSLFSEGPEIARPLVAGRLFPILLEVLPVSVLLALVLLLFTMYKKPGNRFFSFLLPLAAAFVVLAFGYQALHGLMPTAKVRAPTAARYLLPGRFHDLEGPILYLDALDGSKLRGVVEAGAGSASATQKLRYFSAADVQIGAGGLKIQVEGRVIAAQAQPVYGRLLAGGRFIDGLLRDIDRLNRELKDRYQASLPGFYFTCLALLISFFAAGVFFRISRWPLANVLLAFLVMRAFLLLFRFLREEIASEIKKIVTSPNLMQYLPEVVLLVLGVLLLLIDLLFFPFDRWQREMRGA